MTKFCEREDETCVKLWNVKYSRVLHIYVPSCHWEWRHVIFLQTSLTSPHPRRRCLLCILKHIQLSKKPHINTGLHQHQANVITQASTATKSNILTQALTPFGFIMKSWIKLSWMCVVDHCERMLPYLSKTMSMKWSAWICQSIRFSFVRRSSARGIYHSEKHIGSTFLPSSVHASILLDQTLHEILPQNERISKEESHAYFIFVTTITTAGCVKIFSQV